MGAKSLGIQLVVDAKQTVTAVIKRAVQRQERGDAMETKTSSTGYFFLRGFTLKYDLE